MPMFSVIIPTRDRPDLFQRALHSVATQEGADYDIIVINDGTSGEHAVKLDRIKAQFEGKARFIDLPADAGGHGSCKVINTGAAQATGEYLCFLDDDDLWLGTNHLADALRIIKADPKQVDVIFFDQAAFRGDDRVCGPIWIEDLGPALRSSNQPNSAGVYKVDVDHLLKAHGFSHTNATIVRRDFFCALGGFDTSLWYEGDRDFYLRCIDAAKEIRYFPKEASRHNIPDQALRSSLSNSTTTLRKAMDQVYLLHKAAKYSNNGNLRNYARTHRKYAYQRVVGAALRQPSLFWILLKALPQILRARPSRKLV